MVTDEDGVFITSHLTLSLQLNHLQYLLRAEIRKMDNGYPRNIITICKKIFKS